MISKLNVQKLELGCFTTKLVILKIFSPALRHNCLPVRMVMQNRHCSNLHSHGTYIVYSVLLTVSSNSNNNVCVLFNF